MISRLYQTEFEREIRDRVCCCYQDRRRSYWMVVLLFWVPFGDAILEISRRRYAPLSLMKLEQECQQGMFLDSCCLMYEKGEDE